MTASVLVRSWRACLKAALNGIWMGWSSKLRTCTAVISLRSDPRHEETGELLGRVELNPMRALDMLDRDIGALEALEGSCRLRVVGRQIRVGQDHEHREAELPEPE